jgi:hypothetical protein
MSAVEPEGTRTEVTAAVTPEDVDDDAADSATWVDSIPEPPPVSPLTTLPGIAPPRRDQPWPLDKSRKKS